MQDSDPVSGNVKGAFVCLVIFLAFSSTGALSENEIEYNVQVGEKFEYKITKYRYPNGSLINKAISELLPGEFHLLGGLNVINITEGDRLSLTVRSVNQTTLGIRVDYVHQNIVYEDRYASIFVISTKAIRNWTNANLEDSASLVTNSTSTTSDGTKIIWNERWENETDKKLTIEGNLWTYQSNRSWSQKYGDSQTGVKYIDDWFFEIFTFDVNTGVLQYNYRDYR